MECQKNQAEAILLVSQGREEFFFCRLIVKGTHLMYGISKKKKKNCKNFVKFFEENLT